MRNDVLRALLAVTICVTMLTPSFQALALGPDGDAGIERTFRLEELKKDVEITDPVLGISDPATPAGEEPAEGAEPYGDRGVHGGLSWKEMRPLDKVTFVGKDNTSYIDEYGYLSAIPSSTFHDQESGLLYSHPILIYEPDVDMPAGREPVEDYPSIHYLMEDWTNYTDGVDAIDLVCMDDMNRSEVMSKWGQEVQTTAEFDCEDPVNMTNDMVWRNWEEAPEAVVAVIEPPDAQSDSTVNTDSLDGNLSSDLVFRELEHTGTVDVGVHQHKYHNFTMPEDYVYILSIMTWSGRSKDPDLQLYDWQLGQVGASEVWNPPMGAIEFLSGYVYHTGPWGLGLSYMPTEEMDRVAPMDVNPADYTIDTTLYPGKEWRIPDRVPMGATDLQVTLDGEDPNEWLGLVVRDEAGSRFARSLSDSADQTVTIERPGEGYYNFTVLKLENYTTQANFTVSWSWNIEDVNDTANSFASASHGAVAASARGGPMFYAPSSGVGQETLEVMRRLGVRDVVVMDIGNRSGGAVAGDLEEHFSVGETLTSVEESYAHVMDITGSSDVVFTSMYDYTYWYVNEAAAGVEPWTTHIGPATLAGAHHGSAPVMTEMHEETSQAASYFRHYWIDAYLSRSPAKVGDMVLEGNRVYDLLGRLGFDQEGNESILTVAGQFDIGLGFDRMFVGVGDPGRIMGSPTDSAAWVSRSIFYPALIFSNPATDPQGVTLINGSNSTRDGGNLQVTPGGGEVFKYPILQSWVCYLHRFNERASRYWGMNYTTADGITPYWDPSPYAIDDDVNANRGRPGQYYGDMSGSETVPYYARSAGWESAFSTEFSKTMENLNRGTLMWIEIMHGGHGGYGGVGFWGDGETEDNPWRAYETGGSTHEPDSMRMNKVNGMDDTPSTGEDDRDGVIIAIMEQSHTSGKDGMDFDNALDNIHSAGFVAGSCLIAATYLHMTMVRHGSAYQVIDPWLTSWYVDFAIESFVKYLAMNMTVGEAYAKAIMHVGIGFLTEQWWWDIYENVVFFGDPDLRVYSPVHGWDEPVAQAYEDGLVLGGRHSPYGAPHHIKVEEVELVDGDDDGTGNMTLVFASLRPYLFRVQVRDPDGLSDISGLELALDEANVSLAYEWDAAGSTMSEVDDPEGLGRLVTDNSSVTDDGLCTYEVEFALELDWTYPHENLTGLRATGMEMDGTEVALGTVDEYEVENDLDLVGNLTAEAMVQGPLSEGDWVAGGEAVTWSNVTAVYEGWPHVHPPDGEWDITITGANGTTSFGLAPGEMLNSTTYVSGSTVPDDRHDLSIGLIPEECDVSNVSFLLRVDATPPSLVHNLTVRADSFDDDSTELDDDPEVYVTWQAPTEKASGLATYHYAYNDSGMVVNDTATGDTLSFGPYNTSEDQVFTFRIRAEDRVGNLGPYSNASMGIDRVPVVFAEPTLIGGWLLKGTVTANATVRDPGLAGLDGSSVEYQVGLEDRASGEVRWEDWTPVGDVEDAPPGEWVDVDVELELAEGTHHVRWRASDLLGNGPVVSGDQVFHVDLSPVSVRITGPEDLAWREGGEVVVNFTVSDTMSGINTSSLAYRLTLGEDGEPGDWTPYTSGGLSNGTPEHAGAIPLDLPEGVNHIEIRARDAAGHPPNRTAKHRIRVNMNHTVDIVAPINGTELKWRDSLSLLATVMENPDGNALSLTWFSNISGHLGGGTNVTFRVRDLLEPGSHTITLYADDEQGHNVSSSTTVLVKKPERSTGELGGLFNWMLVALVVVVVAVLLSALMYKRRGGAETTVPEHEKMTTEGSPVQGAMTTQDPDAEEAVAPEGPGPPLDPVPETTTPAWAPSPEPSSEFAGEDMTDDIDARSGDDGMTDEGVADPPSSPDPTDTPGPASDAVEDNIYK